MNAKGKPLEIASSGEVTLNDDRMQIYHEPADLPCDEEKRAICESHLEMGLGDELYNEFWLMGCDFDMAKEEGVVRIQLSCVGRSALRKICRMTLTQYDTQGKVLNRGKVRTRID